MSFKEWAGKKEDTNGMVLFGLFFVVIMGLMIGFAAGWFVGQDTSDCAPTRNIASSLGEELCQRIGLGDFVSVTGYRTTNKVLLFCESAWVYMDYVKYYE